MRASWLLLALGLGLGCGPPYDLAVSWRFVDGRACADAGVESVALSFDKDQAGARFRCTGGEGGAAVAVTQITARRTIYATARSPAGGVLYRGEAAAPEPPGPLEILLLFVGGE